jgi:hypothetical protein
MATITYDEVHKLFNYDPEIGIFTNKIPRGSSAKKGAFAGSLNGDGYLNIQVNGKIYKVHRLAWLYVFGYFPENQIDHINRIRTDNRIENLREVSQSCNMKNSKIQSNNTSGVRGVYWNKQKKKWKAYIQDQKRKQIFLGYFTSLLEAAQARYEAELKYDYPGCQTESTALKFINEKS